MLCSFSLQLIFLLRTAVLRKLFDIRFSYKHCNFSHVCLLVKVASKTVTKSINLVALIDTEPENGCLDLESQVKCKAETTFPQNTEVAEINIYSQVLD